MRSVAKTILNLTAVAVVTFGLVQCGGQRVVYSNDIFTTLTAPEEGVG
jgi:hypothetical protein